MTLVGRINIDAIVHDTSGSTAIKILSLESSDSITSGMVAVVTGTVGTTSVSIAVAPSVYVDASGSVATFATVASVVIEGTAALKFTSPSVTAYSSSTNCAAFALAGHTTAAVHVAAVSGTATYSIILVGT